MEENNSKYNPKMHHRRSIRLKEHDYAGGGLYFVTICAHNEFIEFAKGKPFGAVGATRMSPKEGTTRMSPKEGTTCVSPVRGIIEDEWLRCGVVRDDVFPGEFIVMPDHFHGLIRIAKGKSALGNVVGAFKAAVSKRIRECSRGETHVAPLNTHVALNAAAIATLPANIRIWHRNYYEMIVHDDEEEKNISNYIKMNPWKCVMDFGNGLKGMGNPALWEMDKLGVLCSRGAPSPDSIPNAEVYMGGFHSPMEKKILARLLELKKRIIYCPAWGLNSNLSATMIDALEENRLLILEMQNKDGDLFAAEERNRFVIEHADELWVPYVSPGGMLSRLMP